MIPDFIGAMRKHGLEPPERIEPGKFHRFPGIGKNNGNRAGWCRLFDSCDGGVFGDWSSGLSISWQARRDNPMSEAERIAFNFMAEHSRRQAKEMKRQEQEAAAAQAKLILQQATGDPAGHPYAMLKKVSFGPLVKRGPWKQRGWDDALLVPIFDESGAITSISAISPEGDKDYLLGGRKGGCFFPIDKIRGATGRVLIGEGLATAAAAVESTSLPGASALDAGNLAAVGRVVKQLAPEAQLIYLADDDRKEGLEGNPGIEAAERAARETGGCVAYPAMNKKADFWDLWNEQGPEAVRQKIDKAVVGGKPSPRDRLSALTVQEDYVAMIGNETWLFRNLIIKNQIVVIIAKSGGGKTTINFDFVAPWIIEHHGMSAYYFDLDSAASDHTRMLQRAQEMGPKFKWVNPLTHGKGSDELMEILKDFVASGERLDDSVIWFDTMKKFVDMLDKKSVKPFFNLMRQLAALGATVVLLAHANKYRGADGNLVFEGVNDVQADADAMIFLERIKDPSGDLYISTVCDPDKGAKVRGLYEPITFHIAKDRIVTLCEKFIPLPDWQPGNAKRDMLTEEDIQERVREYLMEQSDLVKQTDVIDALKGEAGMSYHRIRSVLIACAVPEHEATKPGQIYCVDGGQFNRKLYGISN